MVSIGALYEVVFPCGVMKTGTAFRALHPTVTSKEMTALTKGKTVATIFTNKLAGACYPQRLDHFRATDVSLVIDSAHNALLFLFLIILHQIY